MKFIRSKIERAGKSAIEKRTARRAFTLIELLVVIAVTAILLTVIFRPLISSYDLTSRATTQIQSQAAGRDAMAQVTALLGNAAYVFDNSGLSSTVSTSANTSLNLWMTNNLGATILITSRHSMVEYVPAAKQLEQVADSQLGAPIDPTTGEPIYDSNAPGSQSGIALPVLPGRILGRIWIGLLDNTAVADTHTVNTVFNPYDKPGTPGDPTAEVNNFHAGEGCIVIHTFPP